MTIFPSSTITFYSGIPFALNYSHTMYFNGVGDRNNFFSRWSNKIQYEDYSYIRHERALKVQAPADGRSLWNYNYLSFTNPDGANFYCFITDINYVNNNTYVVQFTIDIVTTFLPLCTINSCLVEREHVKSDKKGEHTEAEPFSSFGQMIYKCIASPASNIQDVPDYASAIKVASAGTYVPITNLMFSDKSMCAVIVATQDLTKIEGWDFTWEPRESLTPEQLAGNIYNGGMWFYAYWVNSQTDLEKIAGVLNFLNQKGQLDSVTNLFMCPLGIFETSRRNGGELQHGLDITIDVDNTSLGVYTPKNNKLFTYPFNYLYVTNNEGNAAQFKFEYFDAYEQNYGHTFFAFTGQLAPGTVLGIFPRNYCGSLYYTDAMLTTSPYPLCAFNSDVYQAYIALNSGKINAQAETLALNTRKAVESGTYNTTMSGISGIVQALSGDIGGAAGSLQRTAENLNNLRWTLEEAEQKARNIAADMYDISVIPPQAHGSQSGDALMSAGTKGFEFYQVFPNSESCRIIDDYFTMYGYKRGIIKVPELTSRRNWNYVKTSGSRILGSVPASILNALNSIFDNGITFWHNISTYGDYSQDNSII